MFLIQNKKIIKWTNYDFKLDEENENLENNLETDVAQNLISDFCFVILTLRGPFHREDFKFKKKHRGAGLISEKTEVL